MKRKVLWCLLVVGCALAVPSFARVSATASTTIRMASLAPAGSSWDKVFRAWANSLSKDTNGAVTFQFFPGGVAGDERDVIRKMKVGQMDMAGLTSVGLGQIARSISVLQMPSLISNYKQLNAVREKLAPEFEGVFAKEGYRLVGWGDAGFGRVFSKKPILLPSDLKSMRPWIPREEAAMPEMMKIIGANGVALGIPEVFPALQTGMLDTVMVSPIACVALQWFRYVTHMAKGPGLAIVGATLLREDFFKGLAPDHQKALLETGKKAHVTLLKQVELEDAKAYKTLVGRGMIEFDPNGTPAQKKAWDDLSEEMVKRLTGKLWTKELLDKVKKESAAAGK